MKHRMMYHLIVGILFLFLESSDAATFEKKGTALANVFGTKKGIKKTSIKLGKESHDAFYINGRDGKPSKFAIVQKRIYEPNCTHTWVIGVNAKSLSVDEIRVVEMSCPHAFPAKKASFLDQYTGKGIRDLKNLKSKIITIAKATGTCDLTTDAVITAVTVAKNAKGKL